MVIQFVTTALLQSFNDTTMITDFTGMIRVPGNFSSHLEVFLQVLLFDP